MFDSNNNLLLFTNSARKLNGSEQLLYLNKYFVYMFTKLYVKRNKIIQKLGQTILTKAKLI